MPLKYLSRGNFNHVFTDEQQTFVFKVQLPKDGIDCLMDTPERSVRLWNQINSKSAQKATVATFDLPAFFDNNGEFHPAKQSVRGWCAPFIQGQDPTPQEINRAVIDTYNHCGRVLLDGMVQGNFKTLADGSVVCVDIGMALQLQKKQDEHGVENDSWTSQTVWQKASQASYLPWLENLCQRSTYRESTITIKALLALQLYFPHYTNADFLHDPKYQSLKKALAHEIDKPGSFAKQPDTALLLSGIPPLGVIQAPVGEPSPTTTQDADLPPAAAVSEPTAQSTTLTQDLKQHIKKQKAILQSMVYELKRQPESQQQIRKFIRGYNTIRSVNELVAFEAQVISSLAFTNLPKIKTTKFISNFVDFIHRNKLLIASTMLILAGIALLASGLGAGVAIAMIGGAGALTKTYVGLTTKGSILDRTKSAATLTHRFNKRTHCFFKQQEASGVQVAQHQREQRQPN